MIGSRLSSKPETSRLLPILLFAAIFALYATTAARATLFGDPSEYQFIPAIAGIAHPPGYAFYTLLAIVWQALLPAGSIAFRTNLLSAAVGAWVVTVVYLIAREIGKSVNRYVGFGKLADDAGQPSSSPFCRRINTIASLFAALSLAAAPDLWQHAIHANAHVVSAALAATHLWLLIRWWRTERVRWLTAFALTLGIAATHHPITLVAVPAYALFILLVRPNLLRQRRILISLAVWLLVGLTPLLYFPLRSPSAPFGPTDMRTWEGFWGHVTAKGLRVNLFHFGLPDQPHRAIVFWSLLRLQFLLPVILLMPLGFVHLARHARKPAFLMALFLLGHLAFTLNTVQDVMAYLLIPFAALAVIAGIGAAALAAFLARAIGALLSSRAWRFAPGKRLLGFGPWNLRFFVCHLSLVILLFFWPALQTMLNLSRGISLRDFTAAEEYVTAVHRRFDDVGESAVLLSDWEHLTPLWVHAYTQGQELSEEDVRLVYVSTSNPWAESVRAHIEDGPIYLPDYRPAVRDAGFRLVPEGSFYRVVAPPAVDTDPIHRLDVWAADRVHIFGYDLPTTTVRGGDHLALTLYQSVPERMEGIWMPYAQLGPVEARWTTDSRLLTTEWLPEEEVVEGYEIPIPFTLQPGDHLLRLGYADLSGGKAELALSGGGTTVTLATITVLPSSDVPSMEVLESALANLDNQVALIGVRAWAGWQMREGIWQEPLAVRAGRSFHLAFTWRALASPRESQTVFIHLIDEAGRYVVGHDYTPLGGACPTYLWFPKWLPGQTLTDPYRLPLPADLAPGNYWLEVGMYGMTSLSRLPVVDSGGNLAGDRVLLGPVRVQ